MKRVLYVVFSLVLGLIGVLGLFSVAQAAEEPEDGVLLFTDLAVCLNGQSVCTTNATVQPGEIVTIAIFLYTGQALTAVADLPLFTNDPAVDFIGYGNSSALDGRVTVHNWADRFIFTIDMPCTVNTCPSPNPPPAYEYVYAQYRVLAGTAEFFSTVTEISSAGQFSWEEGPVFVTVETTGVDFATEAEIPDLHLNQLAVVTWTLMNLNQVLTAGLAYGDVDLPLNLQPISATTDFGIVFCCNYQIVQWSTDNQVFPAGGVAHVYITVRPIQVGPYAAVFYGWGQFFDPDQTNNVDVVTGVVEGPPPVILGVGIDGPDNVGVGQTAQFTTWLTYTGVISDFDVHWNLDGQNRLGGTSMEFTKTWGASGVHTVTVSARLLGTTSTVSNTTVIMVGTPTSVGLSTLEIRQIGPDYIPIFSAVVLIIVAVLCILAGLHVVRKNI